MKRFCFIWTVGALFSLVMGCVIVLTGSFFTRRFAGQPYDYLRHYYDFVNYAPEGTSYVRQVDSIVIINTHDSAFGSRDGFARLLDSLAILSPKAVGIDQIFPETGESAQSVDDALRAAVERFPHPLVTACRHHGADSLEHSFFTILSGVDYGIVNAPSFYAFAPADSVKGRPVERMVVTLARKAGYSVDETDLPVINYSHRSFRSLSKWEDINASTVNDRIVLIGDVDEAKDSYDVPFRINGKYQASGVCLNAYQLFSLIWPEEAFRVIPGGASFAICFILILLYSLGVTGWGLHKTRVLETRKDCPKCRVGLASVFYVLEPVGVLLVEGVALLSMVGIISLFHLIPNLWVFVAAVPFAGRGCHFAKAWADFKWPEEVSQS